MTKETLEKILRDDETVLYSINRADAAGYLIDRGIEPTQDEFEKFCEQIADGGYSSYVNENLYELLDSDWDYAKKAVAERYRCEFVERELNATITSAFGWVSHLRYVRGYSDEHVSIFCNNGHEYRVNVTLDSYGAIIEDVIKECLRH